MLCHLGVNLLRVDHNITAAYFIPYPQAGHRLSEDTDLIFNSRPAIEARQGQIGFIADAIAYVAAIESLSCLYSQCWRWQRGRTE